LAEEKGADNHDSKTDRVGNVGDVSGNWDNGFYFDCNLYGVSTQFLIDSGSTISLLAHRVYQNFVGDDRPVLEERPCDLRDINGSSLKVYGSANIVMTIGRSDYQVPVAVCDITPDGVLGQDFLLQNVRKLDYEKYILHTSTDSIHCHVGEGTRTVCRVMVEEKINIPGNSGVWVPVRIPSVNYLATAGLIQSLPSLPEKGIHLTEGIIDTETVGQRRTVNIINCTDVPIVLYPQMELGTCVSISECKDIRKEQCASVSVDIGQVEAVTGASSERLPEYLQDLWERSTVHLTQDEAESLAELLIQYQGVFAQSSDDIGFTDRIQHQIPTGDARPIKQPPRRLPFGKRQIERDAVHNMLERGVIEPSISPWASPVVLVTKKDGTARFCVDYRKLNDVTVKDAYPLPRIDECLDSLAGAKWFNSTDLNSGYWQIGMAQEDKEKTAFATHMGLYQFTVLPFGLVSAPSTFSRLMEETFRGMQWDECLIYMDDVIIPGKTVPESLSRLEHVFQRLATANLKLKPSKCVFFQKSIKVLGHVVSEDGVSTDPDKTAAVRDWPRPTTVRRLRGFLGLCSYYRRFVEGFGQIAHPLHKLCEKGVQYRWTDVCQKAFEQLKEALTTAPLLAYPQIGAEFILDTDASDSSVGAVLSQKQEGEERVIAYMSKSMNKHEKLYCVTRKELLAVITALKHFHSYLYGQQVTIRTDNAAVRWMQNLKKQTGQVARWLQEIGTHNLVVMHRAGTKHGNADALSRAPCRVCAKQERGNASSESSEEDECEHHDPEPSSRVPNCAVRVVTRGQQDDPSLELRGGMGLLDTWQPHEIRQQQMQDLNIGQIFAALDDKVDRPEWSAVSMQSTALKTLWRHWDRLVIRGGMLYRKWVSEDEKDSKLQLVVPTNKQAEILKYYHNVPTAGHLGTEKMMGRIQEGFYWPAMKVAVQDYCKKCDQCEARKPPLHTNRAPLGQFQVGEPMERIAVDMLGPLPLTPRGNKYILVLCDYFTKWTEAIAVPDQEAKTVASAIVNEFVTRFGTPLQLHSDQGSCFEAKLFQEMCALLHIDKTRTTAIHPQANGMVERFNRTLGCMLTMYCEKEQRSWDKHLPHVMMAYRASVHSTTGKTPNMMMLGREVTLPMQAVIGRPINEDTEEEADGYVEKLQERLARAHEIGREQLKKNAIYRKRHYDLRAKNNPLKVGQLVWIHDPARKVGVCHKLTSKWKGPFVVVRKVDDLVYLVKKTQKQPAKAIHINRLKTYRGQNVPKWIDRLCKAMGK
jgi:hypothetical protein